jgi:hypothetical protein
MSFFAPSWHTLINQACILRAGDFEVNVFDKDNLKTVNSIFSLDSATIFLLIKTKNQLPIH